MIPGVFGDPPRNSLGKKITQPIQKEWRSLEGIWDSERLASKTAIAPVSTAPASVWLCCPEAFQGAQQGALPALAENQSYSKSKGIQSSRKQKVFSSIGKVSDSLCDAVSPQALGTKQLGRQLLPTAALTPHCGSFVATECTLHCKEEAYLWCDNREQGIAACRGKILPAIKHSQLCWL